MYSILHFRTMIEQRWIATPTVCCLTTYSKRFIALNHYRSLESMAYQPRKQSLFSKWLNYWINHHVLTLTDYSWPLGYYDLERWVNGLETVTARFRNSTDIANLGVSRTDTWDLFVYLFLLNHKQILACHVIHCNVTFTPIINDGTVITCYYNLETERIFLPVTAPHQNIQIRISRRLLYSFSNTNDI